MKRLNLMAVLFGGMDDNIKPLMPDIDAMIAERARAEKMKTLIHEMVNNKFTRRR